MQAHAIDVVDGCHVEDEEEEIGDALEERPGSLRTIRPFGTAEYKMDSSHPCIHVSRFYGVYHTIIGARWPTCIIDQSTNCVISFWSLSSRPLTLP